LLEVLQIATIEESRRVVAESSQRIVFQGSYRPKTGCGADWHEVGAEGRLSKAISAERPLYQHATMRATVTEPVRSDAGVGSASLSSRAVEGDRSEINS
jgi:hypothetical protein